MSMTTSSGRSSLEESIRAQLQRQNESQELVPSQEEVGKLAEASSWVEGEASEELSESSEESIVVSSASSDSDSESDINQTAAEAVTAIRQSDNAAIRQCVPRPKKMPSCSTLSMWTLNSLFCMAGTGFIVYGGMIADSTVKKSKDPEHLESSVASGAAISTSLIIAGVFSIGLFIYCVVDSIKDSRRWQ